MAASAIPHAAVHLTSGRSRLHRNQVTATLALTPRNLDLEQQVANTASQFRGVKEGPLSPQLVLIFTGYTPELAERCIRILAKELEFSVDAVTHS